MISAEPQLAGRPSKTSAKPAPLPMRSAVRFPLVIAVTVRTDAGLTSATTANISAGGIQFEMRAEPQVGSWLEWTMDLSGPMLGMESASVKLECVGRVIWTKPGRGQCQVGAVIDDYILGSEGA